MSKQGEKTGVYGKYLYQYCKETHPWLTVYYDHGNKETDTHVAAAMGFYGEKVRNRNRLTDVDIIVGSCNKKIVLLIEVEQSTTSPKTVLGDILATKMCNKFAVKTDKRKHDTYSITPQSSLFIAFPYKERGNNKQKMEHIESRIPEIEAFPDGISSKNIQFIMGPSIEEVLEKLKVKVEEYLEAYTKENKC